MEQKKNQRKKKFHKKIKVKRNFREWYTLEKHTEKMVRSETHNSTWRKAGEQCEPEILRRTLSGL